ncbi:MAG: flavodoxin-dependent (E)-4-hydroxy-3-methylbut-2-enyl-diphosphate synthase [Christensenellaceae bacterium]|jgi:(E)-4-hydroxy-3-methylbut-2-enyl-diphosphate synthase|nr:flavodoxin-dependent (E)-4-hydroxy-3-methylbut-2-enyl-diphosphate synthase [Christensenellaceae bacterium]
MSKKHVTVKNIKIGGGAPISVQTMTNTLTTDIPGTLAQIHSAVQAGADLVRVSVPDKDSVNALKQIIKQVDVGIIADIHYDYRLALQAIDAGAHKIRINPLNMPIAKLQEVAHVAGEHKIPMRIGINRGGLKTESTPEALAESAVNIADTIASAGCSDLVLSVKSSDIKETIAAYRHLSQLTEHPLHIGLTESGTANYGIIKSTIAISTLIMNGIGDTIRVSLSGDPIQEVHAAKRIIRASGLDDNFVEIIACPTCARTNIPIEKLALSLEEQTAIIKKRVKIAVMGCAVNGLGEAGHADFGVCGAPLQSMIFRNGKFTEKVDNDNIIKTLLSILKEYNDVRP